MRVRQTATKPLQAALDQQPTSATTVAAEAFALSFEVSASFDFMSAEYADLFERSDATAFQHPIWLDHLFRRLVKSPDRSPAVLLARSKGDGLLICVMPMVKCRFFGFSIFEAADRDVSDYNGIIMDRRYARHRDVTRQVLDALDQHRCVRIRKTRNGNIGLPLADQTSRATPMEFMSHEVRLPEAVDNWQEAILNPDVVRYLTKKRKRLRGKGEIAFEQVSEPSRIRDAFVVLREMRRTRWPKDLLRNAEYFEFYVGVAIAGQAAGFCRTYTLSVDGVVVAVIFGLADRGHFYYLLSGFSQELYRNHSTGLLLLESAIEDCITRGDRIFDLTIGDEEYKQKFATQSLPLSTWWFGSRSWIRCAPMGLAALKRALALAEWSKSQRNSSGIG